MSRRSSVAAACDDRRFAFGSNWRDFSVIIDEHRITMAEAGLTRLIPAEQIRGSSFLDIGCGSGLHSLAALRLGASAVAAIDVDPMCVATTQATLDKFGFAPHARVEALSVFDATPERIGQFDIVYSWGVLHHTGNLWRAFEDAIRLVRPGGLLAVAIYRRTPLCRAWVHEKRLYSVASPLAQSIARTAFVVLFSAGLLATGRNPSRYIRCYAHHRGMSFLHDVHDWLGGYPYESATADQLDSVAALHGLTCVRQHPARRRLGVFGTGCSEYTYRKPPGPEIDQDDGGFTDAAQDTPDAA